MQVRLEHFDPQAISDSGQCFRWRKLGAGAYEIPAFDRCLKLSTDGESLSLSCDEEEYLSVWKDYFDMDTDYGLLDRDALFYGDPFLDAAIREEKGIRILRQDFWETLVSFIISQNNNIPRIRKSIERLCGGDVHFPGPSEILEMDLSGMGLGYRDEYLKSAAEWYIAGSEDLSLIKGVGPKVMACVNLYGKHRMSECPMDTWMKKVVREIYGGKIPGWCADHAAGYYQQLVFIKIRKDAGKKNGAS